MNDNSNITEKILLTQTNLLLNKTLINSKKKTRVYSVEQTNQYSWKLYIDSSELSLDDKINIEKQLSQPSQYKTKQIKNITIYFKRINTNKTTKNYSLLDEIKTKNPKLKIKNVKNILAVYSGKGGVGKSTLSLLIAYTLKKRGYKTALLDTDIYGPSCHKLLGLNKDSLQINNQQLIPPKAHDIQCLSFGMLVDDYQPVQWRGPILTKALKQLCFQACWDETDWLVLDLPPGTGDIQMTLFESLAINGVIAITTPQDLALLDVKKAIGLIAKYDLNLYGIIENMAFHQCPKCNHKSFIFGKLSPQEIIRDYGYKHLGSIPLDYKLAQNDTHLSPQQVSDEIFLTLDKAISNVVE